MISTYTLLPLFCPKRLEQKHYDEEGAGLLTSVSEGPCAG